MAISDKSKYREFMFKALCGLMRDIQEAETCEVGISNGSNEVPSDGDWKVYELDGTRKYVFTLRGLPTKPNSEMVVNINGTVNLDKLTSDILEKIKRRGIMLG